MINSVNGMQPPIAAPQFGPAAGAAQAGAPSFKDMLVDSIQQVNTMQQDANAAVENLFTGGDANPAEVLSAVQKADLAFRMMMQVRNKLVAAYQEINDVKI
jgi:flagellar hook-basal body complex protein FliE